MKRFLTILAFGAFVTGGPAMSVHGDTVTVSNSGFGTIRAYPNPSKADQNSKSLVTIDGFPASVVTSVRIFTVAGELVRKLSGTQSVQWDLRNSAGENVASGIYIYLLNANGEQRSGKIAVIR